MTAASRPHRGAFVVLVGPDGVGKTTVARALTELFDGPTAYFHFLPPARGTLDTAPPLAAAPHIGKGAPGGSRLLGCARMARNVARYWLGYLAVVRPALRRGALVVADRGMYGYLVQPHALKFYGPAHVAAALVRLLPPPTLVAALSAPPAVVRERKQELSWEAITHELTAWRELPVPRLRSYDATEAPATIARRILSEL